MTNRRRSPLALELGKPIQTHSTDWFTLDYASLFGGRLSLDSVYPTWTEKTSSTLYYKPYIHSNVLLRDNAAERWVSRPCGTLSLSLAGVTTFALYDVFLSYDPATLTVTGLRLVQWNFNMTARVTALAWYEGVQAVVNGSAIEPYLGTIHVGTSTTITDDYLNRIIWNNYNRVPVVGKATKTGNWGYNGTTWRTIGNDSTTKITVAIGQTSVVSSSASVYAYFLSGQSAATLIQYRNTDASVYFNSPVAYAASLGMIANNFSEYLPPGLYTLQPYEKSGGGGTITFYATSTSSDQLQDFRATLLA